jgi:hypothetical protein
MYQSVLNELRVRWREGQHHIGQDDITRWSAEAKLSPSKFFDELAVELASDFFVGFLGWEFCDGVANSLFGALLEFQEGFEWPDTFDEFYCAFDNSEWEGPRDRELIRSFLEKHKTLRG